MNMCERFLGLEFSMWLWTGTWSGIIPLSEASLWRLGPNRNGVRRVERVV